VRAPAGPDRFEQYPRYCAERLEEDPHLRATALFDGVIAPGHGGYASFHPGHPGAGLQPARQPGRPAKNRPVVIIERRGGAETQ
jgi:hypothetical protein